METTTIDMRPQVKHYEGFGREVLADVHFRIDIRDYVVALNDYSQEAREAEEKAVAAFDNEVVQLLLARGWALRKESYGPGECPELTKGSRYLYCHPQDISGEVKLEDIEALEAAFRGMQSCKYRWTDNYGDVIVTTSEEDEQQLYWDTYSNTNVTGAFVAMATTKRKNLYKCKWDVLRGVAGRLAIPNRRTDLNDIGTGCYSYRKPLTDFVEEHYNMRLGIGLIKETTGRNDIPLCRWANKAEQREIERNKKH